jgi:hypothetical protein
MTTPLAAAATKPSQLAGIGHWLTTVPGQVTLVIHDLQAHVTPPPMASFVSAVIAVLALILFLKLASSQLRPRKA